MNADLNIEPLRAELENKLKGRKYFPQYTACLPDKTDFTESDITHPYYRIVGPNTMVTYDYRVDRLNIMLDANDVCTEVTIG